MPQPSISIRQTPSKGRALTSTETLKPGTTILTTTPLLFAPTNAHLASLCSNCLRPGEVRACTRCRSAYYCGAACQRTHWKAVHGAECKALARMQELSKDSQDGQDKGMVAPTPVRLLLQALLREGVADKLAPLEGHVEAVRGDAERWANTTFMAMAACTCAGKGTGEQQSTKAVELLCKIYTNAFDWSDRDQEQAGVFVEPTLAMMNHSCVPNAEVQVVGTKIVLRASTEIKEGEDIEISYTDYTWPKFKRQEALRSYSFECKCPRCVNNLNVYQASALYPHLDLNRVSIAPELVNLPRHSAVTDTEMAAAAASQADNIFAGAYSTSNGSSQRGLLQDRYRHCKGMIKKDMRALTPVPYFLSEMCTYYAEQENWSLALAMACLTATACDPYRYPAPFHTTRIQGLARIARLLSNTAADTDGMSRSASNSVAKAGQVASVQEALRDIDQVSLCQMLLMLVLRLTPAGMVDEWDISKDAKSLLDDIQQLPGRDKEQSLIKEWASNPTDEQSEAFFKYAVVDPIHVLADLGSEALDAEFTT